MRYMAIKTDCTIVSITLPVVSRPTNGGARFAGRRNNTMFGWEIVMPGEECIHDWEPVKTDNPMGYYVDVFYSGPIVVKTYGINYNDALCVPSPYLIIQHPKNRVCLKCGECDNQVKHFAEEYEKQEARKRESQARTLYRQELAKKLWRDDNC
jgi:hypothetical protein